MCDDYFHPDSENKVCVQDECNIRRDVWTKSGMCLTCGDYSYPDAENHECIVDTCDSETEYLQVNGTCYTCEEGTFPNAEMNGCEEPYVPPVIPDPVTPNDTLPLPPLNPLPDEEPEPEPPVVDEGDPIFGLTDHP